MSKLAQFDGIESLIMEEDAELLRHYASQVTVDGLCLEIGSYQGASAYSILQGLPEKHDLICCSMFWAEEYAKFRRFMVGKGLWNRVIPVMSDFRLMLNNHIKRDTVAFAFIDHDHSEDGMRDAVGMILPLCVNGTILMFHDYGHPEYPAVKQYVDAIDLYAFQRIHLQPLMAVLQRI